MTLSRLAGSRAVRGGSLVLLLAFYVTQSLLPAWWHVRRDRTALDYATFHYAVQEALAGGNPYDTEALSGRGRTEGTRPFVHPYLYPPAFLPFMLWSALLPLHAAYVAWFWVNQVALVLIGLVLRRWLDAPWLLLALLFATFSPLLDNAAYGQVNLLVLLLVVLGLWRGSGAALALAAVVKMSPALYLVDWGVRGRWRPIAVCVASALGYGLLSLSVVSWDAQRIFFREVLPSFSTGIYNGLIVPIAFPINHSLPDLFNQLWPGPSLNTLDPRARTASALLIALSVAGLALLTRRTCGAGSKRRPAEGWEGSARSASPGGAPGRSGVLAEACMAGAWTTLITLLPVYTWEHHLVFLLLPSTALGAAALGGYLRRPEIALFVFAYCCVAWPVELLAWARHAVPAAAWWVKESKFIGMVLIGALCALASLRCSAWAGGRSG